MVTDDSDTTILAWRRDTSDDSIQIAADGSRPITYSPGAERTALAVPREARDNRLIPATQRRRGTWHDDLDRRDEPVAAALQRLDIARALGKVAERVPDLGNGLVEAVVEIDEDGVGPDRPAQRVARYQFARLHDQHGQHPERLFLQRGLYAFPVQLACLQVELENAEADGARGVRRQVHSRLPGWDAGLQFGEPVRQDVDVRDGRRQRSRVHLDRIERLPVWRRHVVAARRVA